MHNSTPPKARAFVFVVSRSKTVHVGQVTVIHTNSRDAAFSAIRQVRKDKSIPTNVALFATQKTQTYREGA